MFRAWNQGYTVTGRPVDLEVQFLSGEEAVGSRLRNHNKDRILLVRRATADETFYLRIIRSHDERTRQSRIMRRLLYHGGHETQELVNFCWIEEGGHTQRNRRDALRVLRTMEEQGLVKRVCQGRLVTWFWDLRGAAREAREQQAEDRAAHQEEIQRGIAGT